MTSVSAGHIIQTPTQPVGSGRPQRDSNPGTPHQESRALPQSYRAPQRFAKNSKWQEDVWATRLSALLTCKSLKFYFRLSREEADDYRMLKLALLRHCEYTAEGYRRKFTGCKPGQGETPALFIEQIKSDLEKWLETAGLKRDHEALRDLFIKEQTLKACPRELAAHLREQKNKKLAGPCRYGKTLPGGTQHEVRA